jgi:hypothetical protein
MFLVPEMAFEGVERLQGGVLARQRSRSTAVEEERA